MTASSRAKGTAAETAVVRWLREHGWPWAERRAQGGAHDRGDVAGCPGVVIEVKSCERMELASWVDETERERRRDGADIGMLVVRRRGTGDPARWYAVLPLGVAARLLSSSGYGDPPPDGEVGADGRSSVGAADDGGHASDAAPRFRRAGA